MNDGRNIIPPGAKVIPDSKVHGANMGPTWVLLAPDGPHVDHMNLAIRDTIGISGVGEWVLLQVCKYDIWRFQVCIYFYYDSWPV